MKIVTEKQPKPRPPDSGRIRNSMGVFESAVTITYEATDKPVVITRNGLGHSFDEAVKDADLRLPVGTWKRLSISSPRSILTDISKNERRRMVLGEGVIIEVSIHYPKK